MIYIVTGGAGFIGSNVVRELEGRGVEKIIVIDDMGSGEKWRNLVKRNSIDRVLPIGDMAQIMEDIADEAVTIIHMGAISSTKHRDVSELSRYNSQMTSWLFELSCENSWDFVYASSAQVYGTSRDQSDADETVLHPVTAYGWSKKIADQMVIRAARSRSTPQVWAGLRFFNVYGPCEDHKGGDMSFVSRCFEAIKVGQPIRLFKGSDRFVRDWVYVDDCARLVADIATGVLPLNGIFNVGTGEPVSFVDVAASCIKISDKDAAIKSVPFPLDMVGQYQAFTKADTSKLRAAAPDFKFTSLADGARDYWQRWAWRDGMDRFP